MRPLKLCFVLSLMLLGASPAPVAAQPASATVRVALVPQWVVNQHRPAWWGGSRGSLAPEFWTALESGVVDRVVFSWQRGAIQRETLVAKPIRVLPAAEAGTLGGRGDFELVAVRPPRGRAAWTELEVTPRIGQPDDVLVLEVGGELNTVTQVLETLLVVPPGDAPRQLGLARRALIPGDGVPVVGVPFGRPVVLSDGPALMRGARGVAFLVARSQVEVIVNGAMTVNGFADVAPAHAGEWREGDRVFVRVPLATLRSGVLSVVLGWKDRIDRQDGGDSDELRRSSRRKGLFFP